MSTSGSRDIFEPSGFFALRTPLLPFDELRAWSGGLRARGAFAEPDQLETALAVDRAVLADRLRAAWVRPAVREAVFLASPELDAALERSLPAAGEDGSAKALRSFVAYFTRMASRATPFGLFAGISIGTLGQHTHLELPAQAMYGRHTRLDMDFLCALVSTLERDSGVRYTLHYTPNSSLYRAGGRLHYAEARLDERGRSYHLVAVESTPELTHTLARASTGAGLEDLAAELTNDNISISEAREFIEELLGSQVLVSDLGPDVTGAEPIHALIDRLAQHVETQPVAACLEQIRDGLVAIDQAGVGGNAPERYAELRAALAPVAAKAEPARLFQVDMLKPAPGLSLGPAVLAELARGLTILHALAGRRGTRRDPLNVFREQFVARYEGAEVALVEALDEEIGIGFGAATEPGGEPLLLGLDPPPPTPEPAAWRTDHDLLLRWLANALRMGEQEIALRPTDLDALAATDPPLPLPDGIEVFARLAASSAETVDRGDFRILLHGAGGPPGVRSLGRFCHTDARLQREVENNLRAEEACRPDAMFAEIVHLPEGRLGNILSRPVLRDYEIPFLGRSGAARDRQIALGDLRISIRGERVLLRSASLDREVLPRLTTAHNFTLRSLGVYRFLCALQRQDVASWLGWDWGPLANAPFLPRVVSGRIVLARACWMVVASELKPLLEARGAAQFAAVHELRLSRGLPRYVALADADNELLIDLDNVLSVEAFLHLVKSREQLRLVELFPPPDELCVVGPEGRFLSELVVPFVKVPRPVAPRVHTAPTSVRRRFPPGSEWLYGKLYTGPAVADRLMIEVIRPAVDAALHSGAADNWFFIRYTDPEHHLRLRFHGNAERLAADLLPALATRFAPLVEDGRIARWQLDTYMREVERYGGDDGIILAERLFGLDSECVLAILESTPGDEGLNWRWKLAACGIDLLLDSLGLRLEAKSGWARERRDAFAREFRAAHPLKRQLGEKFRAERHELQDVLRLAHSPDGAAYPAIQALRRRDAGLASLAQELHALERAGRLTVSIPKLGASYAHMHLNRLLRSAQRFQEFAIYDLLDRTYRAQVAQAGRG